MAEKTKTTAIASAKFEDLADTTPLILEVVRKTTIVADGEVEVQDVRTETVMTKAGWDSLPKYDKGTRKGQPRYLDARIVAYYNEDGERVDLSVK